MSDGYKMPGERDLERNRFLGIIEGASARTIFNLTTSTFLVGFLKAMGADDTICGYIVPIPVLAAGIQFLSPIVLESLKFRKKIIVAGSLIHRLLLSSLIAVPFLPLNSSAKLWLTAAVFLLSNLAVSFITPAASNMYVSFVPPHIRGKYFGTRESYLLLSATVFSLILGKVLDLFEEAGNELGGYTVVYAVVFALTIVNFLSYARMKEVPLLHHKDRMKVGEVFTLPLKNRLFVRYFIMSVIWNIAIQIASAFFSVYLVSDLDMSYTTITLLNMLNSVVYVVAAGIWGRFADRKGWTTATMVCFVILAVCHTIWSLSFKGSPFLMVMLVVAHITAGVAWSGINISLFNLQFDFTPNEKRTVYIGFNAAASGLIGYMAAILGSQLVGAFGETDLLIGGVPVDIKQILFVTSALLIFVCAAYIFFFMKNRNRMAKEDNSHD